MSCFKKERVSNSVKWNKDRLLIMLFNNVEGISNFNISNFGGVILRVILKEWYLVSIDNFFKEFWYNLVVEK